MKFNVRRLRAEGPTRALSVQRTHRAAASLIAFFAFFGVCRIAQADSRAMAEALFHDGTQLLTSGHIDAACSKLTESQKLDPALGTLLYLAACHEKQGRTASAWSEFSSAIEWAQRTNQSERLSFGRKHRAALESRLSNVQFVPPDVSGFELRLDGGLLGPATIGTPLPLDPGEYALEARAPGFETWRTRITIPSDPGTTIVTIPALVSSAVSTAQAPAEAKDSAPAAEGTPWTRYLMWGGAGLAGVGIVTGSIFGVMTLSTRDAARSECPDNHCGPGGLDDIDRAKTYATVSTVAFAFGLAAAGATTYLFIRNESKGSSPRSAGSLRSLAVAPAMAPRQASLLISGSFE